MIAQVETITQCERNFEIARVVLYLARYARDGGLVLVTFLREKESTVDVEIVREVLFTTYTDVEADAAVAVAVGDVRHIHAGCYAETESVVG